MTDYSDLVTRLRGQKLNCTCAAKSASECCCDTDWPESSCDEAADAIEILERDIVLVTDAMVALTGRVAELKEDLHKQADMNGRLLTENAELRQLLREARRYVEITTEGTFEIYTGQSLYSRINAALGEKG